MRKRFYVRLFGTAALTLVWGVVAVEHSPLKAETLLEALQNAKRSNPKLNAERARTRADQERVPQAFSSFMPSVSGDMSYGADRQFGYRSNSTSNYRPMGAGVSASQTLYNGGRNFNDYGRAQQEAASSQANLLATEGQILTQAGAGYMRVVRDRKNLALRRSNLGILREQLAQAEARVAAGDLTRTAIDQTRARLSEAEADHAQSEADLADSEAFYRAVIGDHPGPLFAPNISRIRLPATAQEAIAIAEAENPAIRAAVHSRAAAELAVASAKGAFMPTLSLEGSYRRGFEESPITNYDIDTSSVKLKLSVPIFDGGLNMSRLRQAKETETQRAFEIDDTLATARRSVKSAFELQRVMRQKKAAAARRVAAAENAVKGLQIEFAAGQIPIVELLDGRRELINARISYATAENDEIFGVIQLLAAMGRLNMQTVAELTQGSKVASLPVDLTGSVSKAGKGKTKVTKGGSGSGQTGFSTFDLGQSAHGVEALDIVVHPAPKKTRNADKSGTSTVQRNAVSSTPATTAAPADASPVEYSVPEVSSPSLSRGWCWAHR